MAIPMYRQIAEDLRAQIKSGQLRPGQRLPTEIELRDHYDASRNAVRDAIKLLTSLGLVETKRGQGTFVVQKIYPFVSTLTSDPQTGRGGGEGACLRSEATRQHRTVTTSPVQVEIQQAPDEISDALRIPLGAEIISRHERRFIDGIPWSLQTSYYPMAFADRGAERLRSARNIDEGTVRYLSEPLAFGRPDTATRSPYAIEAGFFKLPPDGQVPVYEITRTAFDGNGQPVRMTASVYPVDRNQFVLNVGDVPAASVGPASG